MPDELANDIERLDGTATAGPWEKRVAGIEGDNYIAGTGPWHRLGQWPKHAEASDADAALIVALRNAAPLIVAALRLAEAELDTIDNMLVARDAYVAARAASESR